MSSTFSLDPSDVRLQYLAEGAANVVYRIFPPDSGPSTSADLSSEPEGFDSSTPLPTEIDPLQIDPRLHGKLIRLRKDLSTTVPTADSQRHFESLIRPLFPNENLVAATLFHPSRSLLKECNTDLQAMEKRGLRPTKRRGIYLVADEPYGCLITDMTCPKDAAYKCFEFKPKWLVQSPSAPAGSRRCRTCALRAMKRASKAEVSEKEISKAAFCPLNLVSIDKNKLAIFVDHILGLDPQRNRTIDSPEVLKEHDLLLRFLYKNPLLDRLRTLQLDLDPNGVFKADLLSHSFLAAMTLRDCTLYLKVCAFVDYVFYLNI